jgi:hypothetical protein
LSCLVCVRTTVAAVSCGLAFKALRWREETLSLYLSLSLSLSLLRQVAG